MSTRASIAIRSEAGPIYCIHLQSDGDLAGDILTKSFSGRGEVWKLIRLGSLSILGSKLAPMPGTPHTWGNFQKDTCLAYGRDRGEKDVAAEKFSSVKAWKEHAAYCDAEHVYLYDEAQRQWYHAPCKHFGAQILPAGKLRPLNPVTETPAVAPVVVVYLIAA